MKKAEMAGELKRPDVQQCYHNRWVNASSTFVKQTVDGASLDLSQTRIATIREHQHRNTLGDEKRKEQTGSQHDQRAAIGASFS